MNGSDDEQHDAHVKCYRIAVAVADGDAGEAAYDKHLAEAGSTDERDPAYRAYVEGVSSAWKDAPPTSPSELLLAPGRILVRHQPDPGREIASRPKHRSAAVAKDCSRGMSYKLTTNFRPPDLQTGVIGVV